MTTSVSLSGWLEPDWPLLVAWACPAQMLLVFILRNENMLAACTITL